MVYIFDNYLLQTWGILNFCYLFIRQKQKKADCFTETLGINAPDEFTIFPDAVTISFQCVSNWFESFINNGQNSFLPLHGKNQWRHKKKTNQLPHFLTIACHVMNATKKTKISLTATTLLLDFVRERLEMGEEGVEKKKT